MLKNTIYWKDRAVNGPVDFAIVGSGIVGLCSAILLKQKAADKSVAIIERSADCGGASIRNAGFVCFGSPTEILDDLSNSSEAAVISTIKKRYEGVNLLTNLCRQEDIHYKPSGGMELFLENDVETYEQVSGKVDYLNQLFEQATSEKKAFEISNDTAGFKKLLGAVSMSLEGLIDPYQLYLTLLRKAISLGVKIYNNKTFELSIQEDYTVDSPIAAKIYLLCTNAFTNQIVSGLDLRPVRNQVFVTVPMEHLDLPHAYHYDKGYIYFRKIDNRLLVGGARNHLGANEETDQMQNTLAAKSYLENFCNQHFQLDSPINFEYQWSGILGVGSKKNAIIRKLNDQLYAGVRLGGMGVAMGAQVADELTDMVLSSHC